jgi:FMN phosphatase YigB (HAD superfamily)
VHVFLDLSGVLLDPEKMLRGHRDRITELLAARFGGDLATWRRAHDEAFLAYVDRVEGTDWDARSWVDVVDELDARNLLDILDRAGVSGRPEDPLALSRQLERDARASVDARYPDARPAIERLRSDGHRVYVATGGGDTSREALQGAGLLHLVDGVFTGHSQNAAKSRAAYWAPIPRAVGADAAACVLVDDRLDYLEAAASTGIRALLVDRKGAHRPESMPAYLDATLRNLAALPPWVEAATREDRAR